MQVGDKISHYILEEKIGDGGFGDVFRARDIGTGMEVAIKCSRPDACESKLNDREQRFMREVSCISKLRHPNIVQLFDYGTMPDGTLYLVMEYVCGLNLEVLIKRDAPFSYTYASEIILQVLDALDEAHRQGIVHRDLKPANIMLVRQGLRSDFVKLLDFGIAKAFNGTEPDLTRQNFQKGAGFGTPQYMPPEQFYGKKIGPHTDLYAVGLVYYELLTGKQACPGKTLSEIIEQQLKKFPEIPAPFNKGPLDAVFKRALAKQISMRYPSAQEMYQDIDAISRFQSPYLAQYASAAGSARAAALDSYRPAPSIPSLPPAPKPIEEDDEASTIDNLAFSEQDISNCNTYVFDGEHDTSVKVPVFPTSIDRREETVVFGDDYDAEDNIPTDDMSLVNPDEALRVAKNIASNRENRPSGEATLDQKNKPKPFPPMKKPPADPKVSEGAATTKQPPVRRNAPPKVDQNVDFVDNSDAPTHIFNRIEESAEMEILTNALPARPDLANIAQSGPEAIPGDEPDIGQLKTMMVNPDVMPEDGEHALSEDLPAVFHQQRTNLIPKNNMPRNMPTYIGDAGLWERITYRLQMSKVGSAFLNSGFYRACRHGHHRISLIVDSLYADHFPELVIGVCAVIIILTLIIACLII